MKNHFGLICANFKGHRAIISRDMLIWDFSKISRKFQVKMQKNDKKANFFFRDRPAR